MFPSTPLLDKIQYELGAQEPWPKDVKLYQPYEVEQILLPDNANCLAVQAFLRMCNLNFEIVSKANAEFMSPSGKVPFIRCGAFVISELEPIVQFVNTKGISLTSELENDQKCDIRAYMSLVHNVLENAELYLCWCDKETYNEVTKLRNGSVYPWPLNHLQNWTKRSHVIKRLKMMGWYSKTMDQVYHEVENCCQALADRLDGKEFFFGKKCTELDALLYGHIYSILESRNAKLIAILEKNKNLLTHSQLIHRHIMQKHFDDKLLQRRKSDHSKVKTRNIKTKAKEIEKRSHIETNKHVRRNRTIENTFTDTEVDSLSDVDSGDLTDY